MAKIFSLQVLTAYMCFTCSSSGVEQHFSKVERCHLERGNGSSDAFRRATIALADTASSQAASDALVRDARKIYAAGRVGTYCRETKKPRRTKGTVRRTGKLAGLTVGAESEASWLRKRRSDLDAVVEETPPAKRLIDNEPESGLTPSLKKEQRRLQGVVEKRRLEAQMDGCLLDSEKASEKAIEAHKKHFAKEDAKRIREDDCGAALWQMTAVKRERRFFRAAYSGCPTRTTTIDGSCASISGLAPLLMI